MIQIDDIGDSRLDVYRDLSDRVKSGGDGTFICEGRLLVERLLASDHQTHSVLIQEGVEPVEGLERAGSVYRVAKDKLKTLVGFDFHRGVLAHGKRKLFRQFTEIGTSLSSESTIVVTVGVREMENLGSIIRSSAGLGASGLVLADGCADAYSRRALRVSMGNVLSLPIYETSGLIDDLQYLKDRYQAHVVAACLQGSIDLRDFRRSGPVILLLGNEYDGLSRDVRAAATDLIKITMRPGVDSLNVGVAAGIMLHGITA